MNFFGGEFFNGGFFGLNAVDQIFGGKGDNPKRRSIIKPTGLPPYGRKSVEQRVQEAKEIHEEVRREVLWLPKPPKPIAVMSLAEIEAEIGERLRKQLQQEDEEIILMLLAAAAG